MNGPLAVAVPALNAALYAGETLHSLNANGGRVRWWFQDAGSSDGTAEIARGLAREGDAVVSEPDAGQADGLNRAMGRMRGEILGFLNADDRWKPWTAEAVLEAFERNPGAGIVYGGVEWIDAEGRVTGRHAGRIGSYGEMLDVYRVWWGGRQWVQPEVFFRREVWERAGGFDAGLDLAFDYDFWVRALRGGSRVARVDRVLAEFRLHDGQKSVQARRAADEIRSVVARELRSGAPVGPLRGARIRAELGYDLYRLNGGGAFAGVLAKHPGWLLSGWVWGRIWRSLSARCGAGDGAGR